MSSTLEKSSTQISIPIGGIIDWYPPSEATTIPDGFVICKGGRVMDTTSPFNNMDIPDLTNLFIVGTDQVSTIGVYSKSEKPSEFRTTIQDGHEHTYKNNVNSTGLISNREPWKYEKNDGIENNAQYLIVSDEYRWEHSNKCHMDISDGNAHGDKGNGHHGRGQHRHDLPIVESSGSHGHVVTIDFTQENTFPPHYKLLKIMRIK